MRGSSPRQKEQKGSSGFSSCPLASTGPLADAGGSCTKSTSQSEQRVNPCRYSALHWGQYMVLLAFPAPKVTLSRLWLRGHFKRRLTFPRFYFDFPVICGTLPSVENCIWSAGACSRFFFSDRQFRPVAKPRQPKSRRLESTTYEMLFL